MYIVEAPDSSLILLLPYCKSNA